MNRNKVVASAVIGAAVGIGLAYLVKVLIDRGYFDEMSDKMSDWGYKTKKSVKNAVDIGINEAEYLKDKANHEIRKGKRKINRMTTK